jgi:tRNA modification GTPase
VFDETIAAIATAPGKGAIAVVRVSGPRTREFAARLVKTRGELQPRYATYATIVDETGAVLDRGLAVFFQAPNSYTGEDALELQTHGSPVVAREVVRALLACGARAAHPGEFTRRAFLNGKMDLHAAAAVADLIDAESSSAARAALANLGGGLANEVRSLRSALAGVLEELAGAIDFPDEVPEPDAGHLETVLAGLVASLERLQHDGELGRLVREGVSVAIVGPPNAGKSSLLNALLGDDRALVSEEAGTTRDTIEESIAIHGVPVRLVDTAGIRAHAGRIEAAGIERTHRALASARIAIVVIDASVPLAAEARVLLAETRRRDRVLFANKIDLGETGALEIRESDVIRGSTRNPATLAELRSAVAALGWGGERPDLERPHIASLQEFDAVNEALGALGRARETLAAGEPADFIAGELQTAFAALGHVSGGVAAEETLDGVFSRFCIGK